MSTISLNQVLGSVEEMPLSPSFSKTKSLGKVSRLKPLKKPYRIKSPQIASSSQQTLNIINFQTQEEKMPAMKSPQNHHFPKLTKLKLLQDRLNRSITSSQDELEQSALKELADSIPVETPMPLFKNQYSIGHKYIPHQKRGRMAFLKKRYKSHGY